MTTPADFYNKIKVLISNGQILDSIFALRKRFEQLHNTKGIDRLGRIQSVYSFLLKFMRNGTPDPERGKVLNDIKEDLLDLNEYLLRITSGKESPELFYTLARLTEYSGLNFSEALGRYLSADAGRRLADPDSTDYKKSISEQNMALKDLFSIVWTMAPGDTKDLESIINVATDSDISYSLRATLVGALIMNLLHNYDRAKFNALLSIESKSEARPIKARTLIGIALVLDRYADRIAADKRLAQRFELMTDNLSFYTSMREVIYSLTKARGAINYLNKMRTDFFPELTKMSPDFIKNFQDESGEINLDNLQEKLEENPEWQHLMKKSGLEKKLRRLTDMQSSGADMFLSMFEQISRNHMYNDIDMWFRPFAEWEADRMEVPEEMKPMLASLMANPGICDTDKFAMLSNLKRLPESARALLRTTFEAQNAEMAEEIKSMMLKTSSPEFNFEVYNYARDLFRFFNFFRAKSEFKNPFESPLNFTSWPFIGGMFSEKEILSAVGEFYYRQGFFEDAFGVYEMMFSSDCDAEWLNFCLQKMGCALEKMGKYDKAMGKFNDAFSIATDDKWLAKKIVAIAEKTSNWTDNVIQPLLLLYKDEPDNLRWLLPLGRYQLRGLLNKFGVTSNFIDRANYISPDNHQVIQLLALRELAKTDSSESTLDKTGEQPGDYGSQTIAKAYTLIRPLIDNAEMYLASLSLKKSLADADSESEKDEIDGIADENEKNRVISDLTVALVVCHHAGEISECINILRSLNILLKENFNLEYLISQIKEISDMQNCQSLTTDLPVMIDALRLA